MEYTVKSGDPVKQNSACMVVGIFESQQLSDAAGALDQAYDGYLSRVLKRDVIAGKVGQSLLLLDVPQARCERLLLIGCGKQDDLDERRYRQILAHAARALSQSGATDAVFDLVQLDVGGRDSAWKIRQAVETLESADYRFDRMKSNAVQTPSRLHKIILPVAKRNETAAGEQAVKQAGAIAAGVTLAKDLGNMPANICTPTYLADQAKQLAKQPGGSSHRPGFHDR